MPVLSLISPSSPKQLGMVSPELRHHNAADYVDAYLAAAGIAAERKSPILRSIDRKCDGWRPQGVLSF